MAINIICVCGAGTMGCGIAQVAVQSRFSVILYDFNNDVLQKAKATLEKNLATFASKGKISEDDKEQIFRRIKFSSTITDCKADVFIEAIVEKAEIKIDLFNEIARLNAGDSIFATNTSSLSITDIAAKTKYRERFIGMHFFNPALLMKLVEVVRSEYTDTDVVETIVDLARKMNKIPVVCKDSPGFIVNRVARPYYIESLRLVEEGIIGLSQIDLLMEATGFKMGPFKLMDLIGNDVNYAVSCSVFDQLHQPERLRPSAIQKEKVKKGELGRKTGKGYYQY